MKAGRDSPSVDLVSLGGIICALQKSHVVAIIVGFAGCDDSAQRVQGSMDYLIANPDDHSALNDLKKMAMTGSLDQRLDATWALTRYIKATRPDQCHQVLPVLHHNMKDNEGFLRRAGIDCLGQLPLDCQVESLPQILQLMSDYPDNDTFGVSCSLISDLGKDGCVALPELKQLIRDSVVSGQNSQTFVTTIYLLGSYCPESAISVLEAGLSSNHLAMQEAAQTYIDRLTNGEFAHIEVLDSDEQDMRTSDTDKTDR